MKNLYGKIRKDIKKIVKEKYYIKQFLSRTIKMCDYCGKLDIESYARYKLINDKYILIDGFLKCQRCGYKKNLSKQDLKEL